MAKVQVYSWNYNGRVRCVVATTSWAKAASLAGSKPSHCRAYGCTTSNVDDVTAAMAQPGVALYIGFNVPHAKRSEGYRTDHVEALNAQTALRTAAGMGV